MYATVSLIVFLKGSYESFARKNAYILTPWLIPLGMFVWGDAVIICLFWLIASGVVLYLQDWVLFLLPRYRRFPHSHHVCVEQIHHPVGVARH